MKIKKGIKNYILNENGLSLVETMLALLVGLIVIGLTYTMLVSNTKTYYYTVGFSELQRESEKAMNIISKIGMESKGITSIKDASGAEKLDSKELIDNPREFTLESYDFKRELGGEGEPKSKKYIFYFDQENRKLSYASEREGKISNISDISVDIDKISIETKQDASFNDSPSIVISLDLSNSKFNISVSNQILFRNKE